jgi:hypothetical protein
VRKAVLLLVLWLVVTLYFPDSRTWLKGVTEPVWLPVVKWDTKEEMKRVGRDVVNYEVLSGKIPDGRNFTDWLNTKYSTYELKQDPWGSTYDLRVLVDSVAIVSYGPDRTRSTDDDFEVSEPRKRPKR